MIIEPCIQRDEDWLRLHLGIPTASQFGRILTPGGKASEQAETYMHELIAERLTGRHDDSYHNGWIERGVELEKEARLYYEFQTDYTVEEVGFIYQDERRFIGCSPDGLVNDREFGLEIKSPKSSTHIKSLLKRELPAQYIPQVQGSLFVTELDAWDWLSYRPELPPVLVRVKRDEGYISKLEACLEAFIEQMAIRLRILGKEF